MTTFIDFKNGDMVCLKHDAYACPKTRILLSFQLKLLFGVQIVYNHSMLLYGEIGKGEPAI